MLTEFRQVIFTPSDLAKALKGPGFPVEAAQGLEIVDIGDGTIELAYPRGDGDTLEKLTLDSEQILRAMIRHCVNVGIPIPRHARKTVEPAGGGLALEIRIDPEIRAEQVNKYYVLL